MEPVSTTVTIYGQEYTVRTESDPEYVRRVASYVDRRMREVAKQSSQVSSVRVAVLAAMTMADEILREREDDEERVVGLEEKAQHLAETLERSILNPPAESSPPAEGPGVSSAKDPGPREET